MPVVEAQQWVWTTRSRIADAMSWLQAMQWSVEMLVPGLSTESTMPLARVMARLSEYRPGIEYLARASGVKERTVCNQLRAWREAGLIAYVLKGGRRGKLRWASRWALVIPPMYDRALGIVTEGRGPGRRMVRVVGRAGRRTIARLARLTARKRPTRTGRRSSRVGPARKRCRGGVRGYQELSTAGLIGFPPEELGHGTAAGSITKETDKKPRQGGPGKRNSYQLRWALARDLVHRVPWLARVDVARVSWVAREVADAGWSADLVVAWLDQAGGDVPAHVHRPSGLLKYRLAAAARAWTTPERRARALEQWRDSRTAAAARHREWDQAADAPPSGPSAEAAALIARALTPADVTHVDDQEHADDLPLREDGLPDPAAMTRDQLARIRHEISHDRNDLEMSAIPTLIAFTEDPDYVRALYGDDLVDRAQHWATSTTMKLTGTGTR
ncbi:hypothetical protein GT354_41205 [Streptomyces sp. SID3343]|nr:hypothetical protein [Streptomyces sp. SID3343]MYW04583.1 hypothetical protein [Streptomyces sp. SID3343]